jgi:DNA polymerase I-like protein with 3'-5' exonuclease and polymerase domains
MFFDDKELTRLDRVQLKELPRTPETNWRPPKDYPNWQYACAIGFDFEVKENDFKRGPGWARGQARICGGSIDLLFPDGSTYTEYRPIHHEVDSFLNLDPNNTVRFWKEVLESPIPKFGANLIYDIGNATDIGIWVMGDLFDCQFAEALLTQDELVGLEATSAKYLKLHKETSLLYEWCAKAYGGEPTSVQRNNIYRASPKLVGPYGQQDAKLPRLNLLHQKPLLEQQNLWDLFRMECDLIRLWVLMRKFGCRVDLKKAEIMRDRLTFEISDKEKAIHKLTGRWLNVLSPDELAPAYDALGVTYPWTAGDCEKQHIHTKDCGRKPSFTAPWFLEQFDPLSELVNETRQLYKLKDTFIESYILNSHVKGYIHGQFHPLRNEGSRNETGGTTTGRLSSSTPDLQNIPSRTQLGKEIMKMFLPDEGHECVESGDYSQIEYRQFMHFAIGPKADEYRQKYIDDPKTDYHTLAQKAIEQASGIYVPRKAAEVVKGDFPTGRLTMKEVNFGKLFGVGVTKICSMAHCPPEKGKQVLDALDVAFPFIKPSQKEFTNEAKMMGYITTRLGRRYRFDLWEPVSEWDDDKQSYKRFIAYPYNQAIRIYGSRIQRAGTHKAMAGRCQGSAADTLKYAMWCCLKSGLYDFYWLP